jgi:predicted secreted hydrolase
VKILGKWKSPHTGCVYPSGWEISLDNKKYIITPQVKDQELRAKHGYWAGTEYWEGTNTVSGDVNGRAYVELNGFCRDLEGTFKF